MPERYLCNKDLNLCSRKINTFQTTEILNKNGGNLSQMNSFTNELQKEEQIKKGKKCNRSSERPNLKRRLLKSLK